MVRQYVGARYVPKFADPTAWTSGTSYEAMTIVTYNNSSYTSKMSVPATVGNPADNPDYWALTGNYNAQVEQYRQETETVSNNLTTEITNRENADTTLQGQITTEITNRENADTTLQGQITTVSNNLTTEITKVMHSIDMITNKVWNAIENGCDNTGETDCKEIIQNALDSGLYHAFYFPSGKYYLSDYVTLRNLTSVKFHGDGIGNTIFNCGGDGFRIFGGDNITIENFNIVGSGNVANSAISFRDDTPDTLNCRIGFSTVKNINIRNFGVGIDFNAPSGYNYFEKVKVSANLDGSVGWAIGNTFANTGVIIPNYIYLDKCQVDGHGNNNAESAISISCGQMIFINLCDFCNIVNGSGIKIVNNNEHHDGIQYIYMINNSIYNVKYGLFVQSRTNKQIKGIDFSHNMVVCSNVDSSTAIAILKNDDAQPVTRVNIVANSITGWSANFEKTNTTGVSEYSSYIAGNFN